MLTRINANGVGLSDEYRIELAERLNIFTGDNGLGKTFVLDLGWWLLTNSWVGTPAFPRPDRKRASITADLADETNSVLTEYDRSSQKWRVEKHAEKQPDIVIYADINGGFSVWDRLRNIQPDSEESNLALLSGRRTFPKAYIFSQKQVWDGLETLDGKVQCNGLIRDLVDWQKDNGKGQRKPIDYMTSTLKHLSCPGETLTLTNPQRMYVDDVRMIPTIMFPHGERVHVTLCSAGIKRILSLCYILVWSWTEHLQVARLLGVEPGRNLIVLMDELELHLHPKWQRYLLPALMQIGQLLNESIQTQMLVTSHSPLVLASVEPSFDESRDQLFLFEVKQVGGREKRSVVALESLPWVRYGDAVGWLTSPIFGLDEARSKEAESAIKAAQAFMRGDTKKLPKNLSNKESIHSALRKVLPDDDEFWSEWIVHTKKKTK